MAIGLKIKQFANDNFGNMQEFAKEMEIKRETLYPIFNGKVMPGGQFFKNIKRLGCSLDWLFEEDEDIKKELKKNEIDLLKNENRELKEIIKKIRMTIEEYEQSGKEKRTKHNNK